MNNMTKEEIRKEIDSLKYFLQYHDKENVQQWFQKHIVSEEMEKILVGQVLNDHQFFFRAPKKLDKSQNKLHFVDTPNVTEDKIASQKLLLNELSLPNQLKLLRKFLLVNELFIDHFKVLKYNINNYSNVEVNPLYQDTLIPMLVIKSFHKGDLDFIEEVEKFAGFQLLDQQSKVIVLTHEDESGYVSLYPEKLTFFTKDILSVSYSEKFHEYIENKTQLSDIAHIQKLEKYMKKELKKYPIEFKKSVENSLNQYYSIILYEGLEKKAPQKQSNITKKKL